MSMLNNLFGTAEQTLSLIRQLVGYAGTFLRALFLPKAALAARLLAAESQLAACTLRIHQGKQRSPRFTQAFRFLWVVLSNYWGGWTQHVHPPRRMQPATVKRWHTSAFCLFRDNDAIYGHGVHAFLNRCNIEEVRTAFRSPWQNPYVERFIGTPRRELLDHVIVLNQGHLDRLLKEYVREYYHVARPHQGLEGGTPLVQEQLPHIDGPSKLISFPVCGGLHHRYERVAA